MAVDQPKEVLDEAEFVRWVGPGIHVWSPDVDNENTQYLCQPDGPVWLVQKKSGGVEMRWPCSGKCQRR
jgi:hypothetical protein